MVTISYKPNKNASYAEITGDRGTVALPVSISELYDERLDEAQVIIVNSTISVFPQAADVKIEDSEAGDTLYFVVANDKSYEMPVGSGRYNHTLYLVERTKLLEGVPSQTLTFTNALGNVYTENATDCPLVIEYDTSKIQEGAFNNYRISTVNKPVSPVSKGSSYDLPTISQIIQNMNAYRGYALLREGSSTNFVSVKNLIDSEETKIYDENTAPHIENVQDVIEVTYSLYYYEIMVGGGIMTVKFTQTPVENQYPLEKWSVTSAVNRVLDLCEPRFAVRTNNGYEAFTTRFTLNSDDAAKYANVYIPDFTLTQSNLREQLKVIAGYVNAEPWLDGDNVIHFESREGKGHWTSAYGKRVHRELTGDINQYCTEVRSNAQNIVSAASYARGTVVDPAPNRYRSLRTEQVNARIGDATGICATQFPIYEVHSLKCGLLNGNTSGAGFKIEPVDITPYVFESTVYNANLSSYSEGYPYSKALALYYTQGQKNIGGLFFKIENAVSSVFSRFAISNILSSVTGINASSIDGWITSNPEYLVFQISYKPIYNTMTSHGKPLYDPGAMPFAQLYNQSENLVESLLFGENVKGVAARLGNVDETRTYIFPDYSYIPGIGQAISVGVEGDKIVSATTTEIYADYVKTTVALTKDFNRISPYVGISQTKRQYEVSERQSQDRTVMLRENIVASLDEPTGNHVGYLLQDLTPIADIFNAERTVPVGSDSNGCAMNSANVELRDKSGNVIHNLSLPVISGAFGNTMVFTFGVKDNYSAGEYAQKVSVNGVSGYFQADAPYGDYFGRAEYMRFLLSHSSYNDSDNVYAFDVPQKGSFETGNPDIRIRTVSDNAYLCRKDSREKLSVCVSLEYKSADKNLFVGSAMAYLSSLVTDEAIVKPHIYLIKEDGAVSNMTRTIDTLDTLSNAFVDAGEIPDAYIESDPPVVVPYLQIPSVGKGPDYEGHYHGWVVAIPQSKETETVTGEDGQTTTAEYTKGGDVLLYSNKEFTVNGYYNTPTIYFYRAESDHFYGEGGTQ